MASDYIKVSVKLVQPESKEEKIVPLYIQKDQLWAYHDNWDVPNTGGCVVQFKGTNLFITESVSELEELLSAAA